jgi:2-methylcitrate dehydratase PrpD
LKLIKDQETLISLGHSERFDLFSSAIIAGTAAHGEDFDDTFEGNPMHVGATMIPAMLSAAQKFNLNGDQILKGLAVGSELICRLALVAPTAMHKQSFHPTAVCGTFGVAAGLSSCLRSIRKANGFSFRSRQVALPQVSLNISLKGHGQKEFIQVGQQTLG